MACELNAQKRPCEEILPSKHQRLDTTFSDETLNMQSLNMQSLDPTNIPTFLTIPKEEIKDEPLTDMSAIYNDNASFPDSSCDFSSAKNYLNTFFNDFDFEKMEFTNISTAPGNLLNEQLQDPPSIISRSSDELHNISPCNTSLSDPTSIHGPASITSYSSDTLHNINPTITCLSEPTNSHYTKKGGRTLKSIVFQKELDNLIFLTLMFHKRQYFAHIKEFKRNASTKELISTNNGVFMDINSWSEFQYKIFAFNLRYKSASFVANNTVLVLNQNNSHMHIKNLKNYSQIELNDYQLQKLKEIASDLNKSLLDHMFSKQLPFLIRQKGTLGNVSRENEVVTMTKLILCIEENMITILNRVFECSSCLQNISSKSLHTCYIFNNREKFHQLGDRVLMLINLDLVVSLFLIRVECISENFLSNINAEMIRNELFK